MQSKQLLSFKSHVNVELQYIIIRGIFRNIEMDIRNWSWYLTRGLYTLDVVTPWEVIYEFIKIDLQHFQQASSQCDDHVKSGV